MIEAPKRRRCPRGHSYGPDYPHFTCGRCGEMLNDSNPTSEQDARRGSRWNNTDGRAGRRW